MCFQVPLLWVGDVPLVWFGMSGGLQFDYSRTRFTFWDRLYEWVRTPFTVSNGMPNSNVCLGKQGCDWLTVGIRLGSICVFNNIPRIHSHYFYISQLCGLPGQQDGHQSLHSSSMTPSPRGKRLLFFMGWENFQGQP